MDPRLATVLLCLCAASLRAQPEAPDTSPAPEVKKFAPLLGAWECAGKFRAAPDGPAVPWTARANVRAAMGGHFVQEDALIDMQGPAPAQLAHRIYYGFDRNTKKFVLLGINNFGRGAFEEISWVDDKTFVYGMTGARNDRVFRDRWIVRLGGAGFSVECRRAFGAGAEFVAVEVGYRRSARSMRADVFGAPAATPVAERMHRLNRAAGDYTFTGDMVPLPGVPKTRISGRQRVVPVFGGGVLVFEAFGDKTSEEMPAYESFAAMRWDATNARYRMIFVNNMGECGTADSWWLDDKRLVTINSGLRFGQPMVERNVMHVGEDGAIGDVFAHATIAGHTPLQSFAGRFVRKKKED